MNQGDIVHLDWHPSAGKEMTYPHYGVILSSHDFNQWMPRVVVAPVTTKYRKEFGRMRIALASKNSAVKGYICLDHIRSIDPQARGLSATNSEITPHCLQDCKEALKKILAF